MSLWIYGVVNERWLAHGATVVQEDMGGYTVYINPEIWNT